MAFMDFTPHTQASFILARLIFVRFAFRCLHLDAVYLDTIRYLDATSVLKMCALRHPSPLATPYVPPYLLRLPVVRQMPPQG